MEDKTDLPNIKLSLVHICPKQGIFKGNPLWDPEEQTYADPIDQP